MKKNKLSVCFMGGSEAGIVGALTILSTGCKIKMAVSYSDDLTDILNLLGISVYRSINDAGFIRGLRESDLLLSVHGREIVGKGLRESPKYGAINIHPYLYRYKGMDPVAQALKEKNFKASVGAHIMESKVDKGEVLIEEFVDVSGANSVEEIYNRLYSHYCTVTLRVLNMLPGGS